MAKRKERAAGPAKPEETFKCSNSTCGLVFSKPIRVRNLREDSEVQNACPRCFTKIADRGNLPVMAAASNPVAQILETSPEAVKKSEEPRTSTQCTHRFGYLSERSRNEGIPDDCVMCENIVKCMLKTVTG